MQLGTSVNQTNLDSALSGDYHVLYALGGIALIAILGILAKAPWWSFIAVLVLSVAVMVDVWAHGFTH